MRHHSVGTGQSCLLFRVCKQDSVDWQTSIIYAECVLRSGKCGHQIYEEIAKKESPEGGCTDRSQITPPLYFSLLWVGGFPFLL